MEALNMSQTRAFFHGRNVHIVINNQIGLPPATRWMRDLLLYCTDVASMIQAPVFHVNGDDPEAVIFVTKLALDYRMTFNKDVVNRSYLLPAVLDTTKPTSLQPTQPIMYKKIRKHKTTRKLYAQKLINEGLLV